MVVGTLRAKDIYDIMAPGDEPISDDTPVTPPGVPDKIYCLSEALVLTLVGNGLVRT